MTGTSGSEEAVHHRRRRVIRIQAALAVSFAVTLTLAGCGGSTTGSGDGGTPGSGASGGAVSSCVETAKAAVAKVRASPTMPSIPKVDAKSVAGKKVWLIKAGSTSFMDGMAAGFVAAARAAGLVPTVQDAARSVTNENNLVQQAATQHIDAVGLFSISESLVQQPLTALTANKATVVSILSNGASDPVTPGIYARVDVDGPREGKAMADWILADSNCNASIASINVPTYSFVHSVISAGQQEIASLCPACKQHKSEAAIATQANDIQRNVQVAMQAHPEISYLLSPYDSARPYVNAALASVTKKPKVVAMTGTQENIDEVVKGGPQVVDFSWAPAAYIGWATVNKMIQGLTGMPGVTDTLPDRLIDSTNVGNGQDLFPALAQYDKEFKAAWGVS